MTTESIGKRRRLVRTYPTSLQRAWELWTTPEGIASWWGPEGFHIEVHRMELVRGGVLEYSMITEDEGNKTYLAEQGMPAAHLATIRYTEIVPLRRLAYTAWSTSSRTSSATRSRPSWSWSRRPRGCASRSPLTPCTTTPGPSAPSLAG